MNAKKLKFPVAAIFFALMVVVSIFSCTRLWMRLFYIRYQMNFWKLAETVCAAAFAGVLVMKRKDIFLIGTAAVTCLYKLIFLLKWFSMGNALEFLAYALMAVLVVCLCEQNLVNFNFSAYSGICKKLWFAPGLMMLLPAVLAFTGWHVYGSIFVVIYTVSMKLFAALGLLLMSKWLADPYAEETPVQENVATGEYAPKAAPAEGYCEMIKHILLMMFTFGIWYLVWIYRTTKFLNNEHTGEYHNPTAKLLLCMFIPFYSIYWFYKQGQRIDMTARAKNVPAAELAPVCLLLGIFMPPIACVLMQDRINSICLAK